MRTQAQRLFCLLALALPLVLQAATNLTTVTGRITDRGGQPLRGFVNFQPTGPTIKDSGSLVGNNPVSTNLVTGAFSVIVVAGTYSMTVPSITTPLALSVPPGGGSYDFLSLTTNVSQFTYATNRWGQISARILPGGNMTFVTNNVGLPNETVTISSTGGGGSQVWTNDGLNIFPVGLSQVGDFPSPIEFGSSINETWLTLSRTNGYGTNQLTIQAYPGQPFLSAQDSNGNEFQVGIGGNLDLVRGVSYPSWPESNSVGVLTDDGYG